MRETLGLLPAHDGRVFEFAQSNYVHWMHHHDELEFNLVTQGTARYLIGDRRYDLRRNTLIWLFPAQDHLLVEQSDDYAMWIMVLKPELIRRLCAQKPYRVLCEANPAGVFARRLADGETARLAALCVDVQRAEGDVARYNAGLAYAVLSAWTMYVATDTIVATRDLHPAVEEAAYIVRDAPGVASLSVVAQRVGLSSSRLSQLFHEQMGISFVGYRNRQRVERFLNIYGQGRRDTLTEAMREAGFGSYPQFYRVFTDIIGYAPTEYKRWRASV